MNRRLHEISLFVAGFSVCAFVFWVARNTPSPAERGGRRDAFVQNVSREPLPPVADAAARIAPSVVSIDIEGLAPDSADGTDKKNKKRKPSPDEEMEGSGSGIIVSADGYIVTNNHVISPMVEQKQGDLYVTLNNGKEYSQVRVVGRDVESDLAVLKIDGVSGLPKAEWGDSDSLRVGDWAVAVGNPLGFSSTVTLGIISALDRKDFRAEGDTLARVIQTDAAINPGSSGGALSDIRGRVIGINTAIASSSGGNVGIGFAIPINDARKIIGQIIATGKVNRPYMGIAFAGIDEVADSEIPKGVELPKDGKGAVIIGNGGSGGTAAVAENSPASRAGLHPFDVIRAINGKSVAEPGQVRDVIQTHKIGEKIAVRVLRSGKEFTASVTLAPMPDGYGAYRPRRFVEDPDSP